MKSLIALSAAFFWVVLATPTKAHPPQQKTTVELPPLTIPPRAGYPQTAERLALPERPGRQLYVDDPIVEDVFIQQRVRQRVTYLPPQYEAVEEIPAAPTQMFIAPSSYAMPMPYTGVKYYYGEPAGAYTKARYGPFGKLREFETSGNPQDVPRRVPGPVRTFFFGGK